MVGVVAVACFSGGGPPTPAEALEECTRSKTQCFKGEINYGMDFFDIFVGPDFVPGETISICHVKNDLLSEIGSDSCRTVVLADPEKIEDERSGQDDRQTSTRIPTAISIVTPTPVAPPATVTPSPTPTLVPTPFPTPTALPYAQVTRNYALKFDGIDDFATLMDSDAMTFDGPFTMEAWIKYEGPTGTVNPIVINKDNSYEFGVNVENPDGRDHLATALKIDGDWSGLLGVGASDYPERDSGSGWRDGGVSLGSGVWRHVAVVFDGDIIKSYVDGVLADDKRFPGIVDKSMSPLFIGARPGEGGLRGLWNGLIDEVRLWNIARSADEIGSALGSDLTGNESGLLGYWKFDDGPGSSVALDSSDHGNPLILGTTDVADNAEPQWVEVAR